MVRLFRAAILMACFLYAGTAFAAGACPSGVPVTGNNCFFIAANGADTNDGASETTPWLHAPGMPNCSANCAAGLPSSGGSLAGKGYIFRGGDTWHFGNSSASPYTGGTWNFIWSGSSSGCVYEGTQSGCVYIGVDKNWYSGSSWTRPILNGDNPTSTSLVASCQYQAGPSNNFVSFSNNPYIIFDNFELTGLCGKNPIGGSAGTGTYVSGLNTGVTGGGMLFQNNLYIHGWTSTNNILAGPNINNCIAIGGGNEGLQSIDHLVIDGSDSAPNACQWGIFPSFYHFRDSIVRYASQGIGQNCHDIHDNIFEHIVPNGDGTGHVNILECNYDNPGNMPNQPQNTPNVWYNNIIRHSNSNVMMWVCPTAMPEYYFNNIMYDSKGEGWSIAGPPGYGCSNTGGQFMFNNTFVDGNAGGWSQPCHLTGSNQTGGAYLTVLNQHLINTNYDGSGCKGGASSSTNVSMSDATATAQGYTTGSAGTYLSNTCANETTTPCAPGAVAFAFIAAASNTQSFCNTLASYTSEYAIGTEAANACKNGTTDNCSYNPVTHTMNCGAKAPPVTTQAPQPPTGLQISIE